MSELADTVREHARDENYHFVGPVEVKLVGAEDARRGDLRVQTEIVAGAQGVPATLVLPDGLRIQLGEEPARIGGCPTARSRSPTPRSRAITPRSGAASAAIASSIWTR